MDTAVSSTEWNGPVNTIKNQLFFPENGLKDENEGNSSYTHHQNNFRCNKVHGMHA